MGTTFFLNIVANDASEGQFVCFDFWRWNVMIGSCVGSECCFYIILLVLPSNVPTRGILS